MAEALGVAARQIKKATAELASNAKALGGAYRDAVKEACSAITDLRSLSSNAISGTRKAAQQLVQAFRAKHRWLLYTLTACALVMGIGIGMLFEHGLESPPQPTDRTAVVQPAKPRPKP
jgi:hypothetical protein